MKRSKDFSLVALLVVFLLVTAAFRSGLFKPEKSGVGLLPNMQNETYDQVVMELKKEGYDAFEFYGSLKIARDQRAPALAYLLTRGLPATWATPATLAMGKCGTPVKLSAQELEGVIREVLVALPEVARVEIELKRPEATYFQDEDTSLLRVKVFTWSGEELQPEVRASFPFFVNHLEHRLDLTNVTIIENPEL